MITLLARIFIKNHTAYEREEVRSAYGTLCSVTGIVLNLLLFLGKYLAGTLSGSVAITADSFNNLSDTGSSVITLIGFQLAKKEPDPEHPFGHGRFEYLSGFLVSALILMMGVELGKESVQKLFHPEPVTVSWTVGIILVCSIVIKLYMAYYNGRIGTKIHSSAMRATMADSLSDTISTAAVLVCMLITALTGVSADGICGVVVSALILRTGWNTAKETLSPLLGQPPSPELVAAIERSVLAYPDICGVHDLIVHDYGPGRMMISLHAEVPGTGDFFALHDTIDCIERHLQECFSCSAVIHMDPIASDDEAVNAMRLQVAGLMRRMGGAAGSQVSIHDFRMVQGPTHTNLIFDVCVPFDFPLKDDEIRKWTAETISRELDNCFAVIQIDKQYTAQS